MDNIIMSFLENNRNIVGDFHLCNSETYSTPNVRPNVYEKHATCISKPGI